LGRGPDPHDDRRDFPAGSFGAVPGVSGIGGADGSGANLDFGAMVSQGLHKLQEVQNTADDLSIEAATGRLTDVHDYIIAATEATLATSLTVSVRNRALEAFNEIMRMQA
jgi:flagellar hook-basal body complex protein FliE